LRKRGARLESKKRKRVARLESKERKRVARLESKERRARLESPLAPVAYIYNYILYCI
jgi:hypothetical protein